MLTDLQKNQIKFTHKLNLNGLILDAITALDWNACYMSWNWKFR